MAFVVPFCDPRPRTRELPGQKHSPLNQSKLPRKENREMQSFMGRSHYLGALVRDASSNLIDLRFECNNFIGTITLCCIETASSTKERPV